MLESASATFDLVEYLEYAGIIVRMKAITAMAIIRSMSVKPLEGVRIVEYTINFVTENIAVFFKKAIKTLLIEYRIQKRILQEVKPWLTLCSFS